MIGVLLRLKIYIQNRSLFIDEASLARNIAERSYGGFFSSLSYQQYAPPLFLVKTKMVTEAFGNYEWALRLIPLLAGLWSMWLLWLMLKEWVKSPVVRVYGLSMFCLAFITIRYGTDFKQYSSDGFLALLFLWLATKDRQVIWTGQRVAYWAFFGSLGIWYSMPLVFILSGVGLFFLSVNWKQWRSTFIVISTWLLSFGAYYFLILQHNIGSNYLENYFGGYFIELHNLSAKVWKNNSRLIIDIFKSITDKTTVSIAFGIATFLVGVAAIIRNDKTKAILVLIPIVALLLASILHYYTLMPRLTLFIFPSVLLIMCLGLDLLFRASNKWVKILLLCFVILGIVNKRGWDYIENKMVFEEIKPCLTQLQNESKVEDFVFVDHEGIPAFMYYTNNYEEPFKLKGTINLVGWNETISSYMDPHIESTRWLLFAHAPDYRISRELKKIKFSNAKTICRSSRVALIKDSK